MKSSIIKFTMLAAALIFGTSIGVAQTVTVGPTGTYATPCAAFPHLTSGETVQVDANGGTPYYDTSDCLETAPNITIVGVNGRPIIDGSKAGIAKAMWLIDGHDVIVDNFEFRNVNTSSSSTNAEAIRIENGTAASPNGGNVTIQRCYIHNNFEGILSDSSSSSYAWYSSSPYITFQYDEFANNGYGDGFTHNMYLGANGNMNFTLQYSWSHDAFIGNVVKDRGPINNILYNLIGDGVGASSYVLDFPLGGSTYIVGNSLYKVAVTNYNANENMIMWRDLNDEGSGDPGYGTVNQDLHVINNTVINGAAQPGFYNFFNEECAGSNTVAGCGTPPYGPPLTVAGVFENNIFLGEPAQITNDTAAKIAGNVLYANTAVTPATLATLDFNNPAQYDYRLLAGSPAIQAGIYPPTNNAGGTDSKALALFQYVNPVNNKAWPTPSGSHMDAGAFPYQTITPPSLNLTYTQSVQSPNSGTITVTGLPTPGSGQYNYAAFYSTNQAAIPNIESVASSTGTVTTTFQAYPVAATTVVPIYIYVDSTILTANVTVTPGPTQLQSVTLDSVYYPTTTTHLLGPGTSPVVVSLSSSNPTILYTPATVTIPTGQLSAENGTLNGALNPPALSQSAPVTLTATYNGQSVYLTAPIYSPGIHNFYCNTCTVTGGTPIGFGLIFAGDIPHGGANVTLTSSNTAAIPNQTFPQAQGINIGNASVATNSVTTSTNVNLTFTFNGATSGSTVTLTPGAGTTITAVSGSGQSAAVGTNFTNPLVVKVLNGSNPVSGALVTFSGTGISFPSGNTATTGSNGQAQVTAGASAEGSLTASATVSGASGPATFSETGTVGAPASIAVVSGSGQSSPVGTPFANPLVVIVKDANGDPVPSVLVTYSGTSISFPNGATATTGSNGEASVTAEPTAGGSLTVKANVSGVSTAASFSETGTTVALSSITQDSVYQAGTTVHLTAAATSPFVVNLTTSNSSILYTPATVTVPQGQSTAETGTLLGSLWGQTPTSKSATLTGKSGGVTKTLTFNVPYTTIHGWDCPSSVVGGQQAGCYLETAFSPAPEGGAPFTVTSNNTAVIPNQNFTLPAGQSNDFNENLTTNAVSTATNVTLTLTYNGATAINTITVNP